MALIIGSVWLLVLNASNCNDLWCKFSWSVLYYSLGDETLIIKALYSQLSITTSPNGYVLELNLWRKRDDSSRISMTVTCQENGPIVLMFYFWFLNHSDSLQGLAEDISWASISSVSLSSVVSLIKQCPFHVTGKV